MDTPMFSRASHSRNLSEVDILLTPSYTPNGQDLPGAYGHPRNLPGQDAISQWYATNDGPWIPKGLALPEDDERSPSRIHTINLQNHAMGFPGHFREGYMESECETTPPGMAPSDSGYGTGSQVTKQSVTANSVYDESSDRNAETQSLTGHLSDFHFPSFPPGDWGMAHQPQSLQQPARQFDGKNFVCETCKKPVKTNSELK